MSATDGSEMDGYEALVSELRANPPVAPERLRQRVLEGAPAARAPRSRKRKLVFVVVPAAVVLAVGAALVHGFVNSGSRSEAQSHAAPSVATLGPNARVPGGTAKNLAPTLGADHGSTVTARENTYSLVQGVQSAAPDALAPLKGTRQAVSIPKNRLVHAVASLQVGVK